MAGITYDCDTAADHFSELILPAGATPFQVTGKVRLMQTAQSDDYSPVTRIAISNQAAAPGPSNEGWAGLRYLVVPPSTRSRVSGALLSFSEKPADGAEGSRPIGPPSAEEVAFSLVFDGAEVTATMDGKEAKLTFRAARPVVRIVCSTGEFLYTDLVIRPLD